MKDNNITEEDKNQDEGYEKPLQKINSRSYNNPEIEHAEKLLLKIDDDTKKNFLKITDHDQFAFTRKEIEVRGIQL